MKNTLKHQTISTIRGRAASAALALAAVLVPALVATQSAKAQTFKVLHDFVTADGPQPEQVGLIQGTNGAFYGTTQYGGQYSEGTVFEMTPGGTLTTLYSFFSPCQPPPAECVVMGVIAYAPGPLVLGANSIIYGTVQGGGAYDDGTGIVYSITQSGTLTTLADFSGLLPNGQNSSGAYPVGALVQATNGAFWGVTQYGGTGTNGQGVIYEISPQGQAGPTYSFDCEQSNCNNDDKPVAGLVQGTDGNFYGTTEFGGTGAFGGSGAQYGGSFYKFTPGQLPATLYSFCSLSGCADGQAPMGALVQGADGNFYGTTAYGGTGTACLNAVPNILGCGTVFEITPTGTLTTLYNFCTQSGCPDGQNPMAGLILGSDWNFYGTTQGGGRAPAPNCSDNPCGTIFEITPSGTLTTLYSFCYNKVGDGCPSGAGPVAPLVQYTNGDFYGTTVYGGNLSSSNGTVFRLSTGLGPFVRLLPASAVVLREIRILGTNLTGATSVTFNGVSATFTVESAALITATVPASASSGPVQVTTPNGTLTSNVNFVVSP